MSHREQLANLLRAKSIKRGDFTLASGKKSNYYLDCRLTTLDAEGALLTGYCVLELLDEMGVKPDAIGGLSMGADPVVSAAIVVSAIEKRPVQGFLVRKEAKGHGRKKQIEGMEETRGKRVAIVDDVCTTGGSTQEAIEAAEREGCEVVAVISLVDREEGGSEMLRAKYNYRSIFTASELLNEGSASARPYRAPRSESPGSPNENEPCALRDNAQPRALRRRENVLEWFRAQFARGNHEASLVICRCPNWRIRTRFSWRACRRGRCGFWRSTSIRSTACGGRTWATRS